MIGQLTVGFLCGFGAAFLVFALFDWLSMRIVRKDYDRWEAAMRRMNRDRSK